MCVFLCVSSFKETFAYQNACLRAEDPRLSLCVCLFSFRCGEFSEENYVPNENSLAVVQTEVIQKECVCVRVWGVHTERGGIFCGYLMNTAGRIKKELG